MQERFFSFEDAQKLKDSFLKACEVFQDYAFILVPTLEKHQEKLPSGALVVGSCEDGQLITLRRDWTISLARFMSSIRNLKLPLKVFYWGNVFSVDEGELFQMGVEHLGYKELSSDAEVINRLCQYLKAMGVNQFVVSIGHMGIIRRILEKYQGEQVIKYLFEKNFSELKRYPELFELLFMQGDKRVVEEFLKKHPEFERECKELLELSEYLKDTSISFDLSEIRLQDYYTGVIFEVFHPKLGYPIAGGGRYDRLYSAFGKDTPAVGGAVYLDRLLEI